MGQYHSIFNLDKKIGYSSRSIGAFSKAGEQGQSLIPGAALLLLLSDPNGWGGERVALIGDYAEDTDLTNSPFPASELYARIGESRGVKNVGWMARKVIEDAGVATFSQKKMGVRELGKEVRIITFYESTLLEFAPAPLDPAMTVYNHDKRERLTPTLLGDPTTLLGMIHEGWDGGTGTALTILLAASCKGGMRGGGDYDGQDPLVGSWAGDHIAVTADAEGPKGYEDITNVLRDRVMAEQVDGIVYEKDEKGRVTRAEG